MLRQLEERARALRSRGGGEGGRRKGGAAAGTAVAADVPAQSFGVAWSAYCAGNPRLRDPRALPLLVRRGVPMDLRLDVWAHCLGVDPAAAAAAALPSGSSSAAALRRPVAAEAAASSVGAADNASA